MRDCLHTVGGGSYYGIVKCVRDSVHTVGRRKTRGTVGGGRGGAYNYGHCASPVHECVHACARVCMAVVTVSAGWLSLLA